MEALMDRSVIAEITSHFKALSSIIPLHPISSERDYDKAVATLNQLLVPRMKNTRWLIWLIPLVR